MAGLIETRYSAPMVLHLALWTCIAINIGLIAYYQLLTRRLYRLIAAWEAICFIAWSVRYWPGSARILLELDLHLSQREAAARVINPLG